MIFYLQKITRMSPSYYKCFKELQPLCDCIIDKSEKHTLAELTSSSGDFTLSMPNTCRYKLTYCWKNSIKCISIKKGA